jgi:chromosome segregation ATPase
MRLERENAELRKQLSDIEEREAACCPEDVPFDNLITVLRQRITRLEREIAELKAEIEKYKVGKVAPADYYSMAEAEEKLCKELAEARAEIERLKHFERCLKEEFLLNTQNYPKEYLDLFQRKFNAVLKAAERGE